MIAEVENGVGTTGVRPGIIGEIGSNDDVISDAEAKSVRAAARTLLATGLTISTHADWFPIGLRQLDILEAEGVGPRHRGHANGVPGPAYQLAPARRGCYVEFDGFGTDTASDAGRTIDYLLLPRADGHLHQVLVSYDVFLRTHLRAVAARATPGSPASSSPACSTSHSPMKRWSRCSSTTRVPPSLACRRSTCRHGEGPVPGPTVVPHRALIIGRARRPSRTWSSSGGQIDYPADYDRGAPTAFRRLLWPGSSQAKTTDAGKLPSAGERVFLA